MAAVILTKAGGKEKSQRPEEEQGTKSRKNGSKVVCLLRL